MKSKNILLSLFILGTCLIISCNKDNNINPYASNMNSKSYSPVTLNEIILLPDNSKN